MKIPKYIQKLIQRLEPKYHIRIEEDQDKYFGVLYNLEARKKIENYFTEKKKAQGEKYPGLTARETGYSYIYGRDKDPWKALAMVLLCELWYIDKRKKIRLK